jgi:hypothetical protein
MGFQPMLSDCVQLVGFSRGTRWFKDQEHLNRSSPRLGSADIAVATSRACTPVAAFTGDDVV